MSSHSLQHRASLQIKGLKASMAEAQAVWKQLIVDNFDIAKNCKALLLKYQEDKEEEMEEKTLPLVELTPEAGEDEDDDDDEKIHRTRGLLISRQLRRLVLIMLLS